MLRSLSLSNFIIIEGLTIDFSDGFSVFTGETGAGKSVLLAAISFVLGNFKTNKNISINNSKLSSVIAIFSIAHSKKLQALLSDMAINIDDKEIIIRRVVSPSGGLKTYINDIPVSLGFLKNIGALLVDVHGQFDNQKLLNVAEYINLIDSFIDINIIAEVKSSFNQYKEAEKTYQQEQQKLADIISEQDYIKHSLIELSNADIKVNEELELLEQKKLAVNFEKDTKSLKQLGSIVNQTDILLIINNILTKLEREQDTFESKDNYSVLIQKLNSAFNDLTEAQDIIQSWLHNSDREPFDLDKIEGRLVLLRTLAKKHKTTVENLPELTNQLNITHNSLESSILKVKEYKAKLNILKESFLLKAKKLSNKRSKLALLLEQKINQELHKLKLKNAQLKISIQEDSAVYCSDKGINKVDFLIKTNVDSKAFSSLSKVASGGEMARIMLALKVGLAENYNVDTIIFDEIDVGVGGEVAHSVGSRMVYLAEFIQTLTITHSHQVAALAKHHYQVLKVVNNGKTIVKVNKLSTALRVQEIARMISADKITEDAISIAKKLLNTP